MADRRSLRTTFTSVAELYERARPGYPDELFDDMVEISGLPARGRVLEIGCGTGQATRPMAERGFQITCVELGEDMAAVARRVLAKFPNVEVVNSAFETWPLPREPFDLVMAATAFHWVEREHAEARVAAALKRGGALAVLHHHHVAGGTSAFFSEVQRCYEQFMPGTPPGLELEAAVDMMPFVHEIESTELFETPVVRMYPFDVEYSTASYLDVLRTYSGHIALDQSNRAQLFECISALIDGSYGGRIVKRYLTSLVVARRR